MIKIDIVIDLRKFEESAYIRLEEEEEEKGRRMKTRTIQPT